MSRVGKAIISIPQGIEVKIDNSTITVKGKNIEESLVLSDGIGVEINDNIITLSRPSESKVHKAKHGLYRALLNNIIIGLSSGFKKELELVGVGYRASNQGQLLDLSLGFSHNILLQIPNEVVVETKMDKGKNPIISLSSHNKQLLGMVASKIRGFRQPEPYKGKGVRYVGEDVRRKAGKSA